MQELYDHQKKIIREDKLKCGLFLGTGASKTRTALHLAEGSTLVICPKQQRDDETWQRENEKWQTKKVLWVISKEDIRKQWDTLPNFTTVIIDECFVKGTKILTRFGYENIENIKEGDIVANATGYGKVYKTIKNTTDRLFTFKLQNGRNLTCTGNHPLLTTKGWVRAEAVDNSTLLVSYDDIYWEYENQKRIMQDVWQKDIKRVAPRRFLRKLEDLLFNKMSDGSNYESLTRWAEKERKAYLNFVFKADDRKQSDEERGNKEKSLGYIEIYSTPTESPWWKRFKDADTTESSFSRSWEGLVSRICNPHKNHSWEWISHLLQNRYSQSKENDSHRSRWWKSLLNKKTGAGLEENKFLKTVRVESITVQKQRGDDQSSKGIEVYNLSVSGHPSYVAEGVIVHNCHNNLGVLPQFVQRKGIQYPKASQIFEATQKFLKKHPPKRLYLLSATPVPKPMSLWAIATLLGQNWDFYKFREKYYMEIRLGGLRRIWIPRRDEASKQKLAELVQTFGYTGGLNDFFDVPEQTHKIVEIEPSKEQKEAMATISQTEADPLVRRARLRTIENGVLYGHEVESLSGKTDKMKKKTTIFKSHKIDYILERALEFPKLLIYANYTAQIEEIAKALRAEGYAVTTLTGATKDRNFIRKVDENPDPHIIVAQCSISSGYELPSFPCVIYASKSWRFVDYEQSLGRVLRANHLKKNLYIHLVVKGCDMDCHKAIMSGSDFQERLTLNI